MLFRSCKTIYVCTPTEYESVAPTSTSNRKCESALICTLGQYESKAQGLYNNRECTSCPVAHKCDGSSVQTPCTGNTYQDEENQSTCKQCASCPTGQIRTGCGTASPGKCVSCPAGYAKTNRYDCTICAAGKFEVSRARCDTCTAGRFSAAGVTGCTSCATGEHQDEQGQSSCKSCDGWAHTDGSALDHHSDDAGHTRCSTHTTCNGLQWETKEETATATACACRTLRALRGSGRPRRPARIATAPASHS